MRAKTLALATALSALAGAALAAPGGHGGIGGGVVGGVGGGLGAAGGIGHGGPHGGVGGGIGAGIGGGVNSVFGTPGGPTHMDGGSNGSLSNGLGRTVSSAAHATDHLDGDASAAAGGRASRDVSQNGFVTGQKALAGLSAGETVLDASGQSVGTVDLIERNKDGTVTGVLMTTADGRLIRLEPGLVRVSNGTVTTRERLGSVVRRDSRRLADRAAAERDFAATVARTNARTSVADAHEAGRIARDNARVTVADAREAGRVARANARVGVADAHEVARITRANARVGLMAAQQSLAGLSPGMTVRSASGTTLGTVARVVRSANGRVQAVLVRTASRGRRVLNLAPRSLTISGGVVTTTQGAVSAHG